MEIIEEHSSVDRLLRLIVSRDANGDISIGFDGYTWHTYGDILESLSGLPQNDAIREFVDRIINDVQIIVVSRLNGKISEVWPTDDPKNELKHKSPEESLEFRRWSGEIVCVEPPPTTLE